jgi:hypothetical protein
MDDETKRAIGAFVLSTRDLLQEGVNPQVIHDTYVENGMKSELAWSVINQSRKYLTTSSYSSRPFLSDERKSGLLTMAVGVGFFILGGTVTAISYNATAPGGTYLVTTGLFIVGVLQFFRGLWRLIAG